jgi:hypothetical protein
MRNLRVKVEVKVDVAGIVKWMIIGIVLLLT